MCNLNLSRRSLASSITLRILTALILVLAPAAVYAVKGPCSVTGNSQYVNGVTCQNGSCVGMVQIVPEQRACQNANEFDCFPLAGDVYITYQSAPPEYSSWSIFYGCIAPTGACEVCAIAAAYLCWEPPFWQCFAGVAGCGLVCVGASGKKCCGVNCFFDPKTRVAVPGGSFCN